MVPNHLTGERAEDMVSAEDLQVEGRAVAKRLKPVAAKPLCAAIWRGRAGRNIKNPARSAG